MIEMKPVPMLNDVFCLSIGKIKCRNDCREWFFTDGLVAKNGYKYVRIPNGRRYSVHRLIARTFVFNPAPLVFNVVHHLDNDRFNNHATNLQWTNQQLNSVMRKDARLVVKTKSGNSWRINFIFNKKKIQPRRYFENRPSAYQEGLELRQRLYDAERNRIIKMVNDTEEKI